MDSKHIPAIQKRILLVGGMPVILDSDLAQLYGVETKVLNRAISRNLDRFPKDFSFKLSTEDWENLRCQFGTSSSDHGGRRYLPRVFTEHSALMASTILRSEEVVKMSTFIIRAFVKMREKLASNREVLKKASNFQMYLLPASHAGSATSSGTPTGRIWRKSRKMSRLRSGVAASATGRQRPKVEPFPSSLRQ